MLVVKIIERKRWSTVKYDMVTERKFTLECPLCGWLINFKVVGKIERAFARFIEKCDNPECGALRPDIERMVDQQNIRIVYSNSKLKNHHLI